MDGHDVCGACALAVMFVVSLGWEGLVDAELLCFELSGCTRLMTIRREHQGAQREEECQAKGGARGAWRRSTTHFQRDVG